MRADKRERHGFVGELVIDMVDSTNRHGGRCRRSRAFRPPAVGREFRDLDAGCHIRLLYISMVYFFIHLRKEKT